ncbi:MAG: hypothetical protein JWO67_4241 [Streptosporangiaceae bacterium]|nr:hypothetical protein [Streptosporangiaceae bacterium]
MTIPKVSPGDNPGPHDAHTVVYPLLWVLCTPSWEPLFRLCVGLVVITILIVIIQRYRYAR